MMYGSYQERQQDLRKEPKTDFLATVYSVASDGIRLKFDGETEARQKKYKFNKSASFSPGQRVKVAKVGGTYIVEYPIGG